MAALFGRLRATGTVPVGTGGEPFPPHRVYPDMSTTRHPGLHRTLTTALTTLAVFAVVPALAVAQQKTLERIERTIPFAPGGLLKLKNFSGDIRIIAGGDDQVVIKAVRRGTRERLEEVKLEIEADARRVTIQANRREGWWPLRKSHVVETEFEIAVPAHTELDLDAFASDIRVTGVEGPLALRAFSGAISVKDVTGPLEAKTFSGDVHLDLREGVQRPDIDVKTFSGDIVARVGGQTSARVRFNTFSGDLRSDLPLLLESGNRRNLTARLNQGGESELFFKTFSGDVRIAKD